MYCDRAGFFFATSPKSSSIRVNGDLFKNIFIFKIVRNLSIKSRTISTMSVPLLLQYYVTVNYSRNHNMPSVRA